MSYVHNTPDNIAALVAAIPGLDPAVADAWLRCEAQAVNNPTNPLNIRFGPYRTQSGSQGGFGTYASPAAGLADAGWLIERSSYYAGVRAALAAHGTHSSSPDPVAVAHAIEASPWAGGHYGGGPGKAGCIAKGIGAAPAPKPPAPAAVTYTVRAGDSLWSIAAHLLHDGSKWPLIYAANRKLIGGNPNLIRPGQVLTIPGA